MSFLDSLKAAVAKDSEARRNVEAVLAVAGDKAKGGIAGLGGLVDKLKDSELADNVSSWVSSSANRLPSAEQVQRALGADAIGKAAKKLGVSGKEAADRVARALPSVIDNISPTGKLPENLDHIGEELKTLLKDPKNRAIAGVAALGIVGAAAGAVLAARAKSAKGKAIAAGAVAGAAALAGVAAAVIARGKAKPKAAPAKPAAKPKAAAPKKPAAKKPATAKPKAK